MDEKIIRLNSNYYTPSPNEVQEWVDELCLLTTDPMIRFQAIADRAAMWAHGQISNENNSQ